MILLLQGSPPPSQMFRNLIPLLADKYHVIAPDYPGYGFSEMPDRSKFSYTFDNYADIVDKLTRRIGAGRYALYMMDYGAPVGFRLAVKNPDRVTALIIQNGNAYDEGLLAFWDPIKAYWKTGAPKEREALRFLTQAESHPVAIHERRTGHIAGQSRCENLGSGADGTALQCRNPARHVV